MGKAISLLYDVTDHLYDKHYPKNSLLRPSFLWSATLVALLGSKLIDQKIQPSSSSNNLVFLFGLGSNLGMNIWISFFSGMTMIRLLPRHQFGIVQSNLFPKFFFLTSTFSFGSLYSYLKVNPISSWSGDKSVLGCFLGGSFALNLINLVWFNKKTIDYNLQMHQIEKNAGVGITIIGQLKQQSKVESDPEYQLAKKKFRIYHSFSLTANTLSFASTLAQFYLLANGNYFSL
ncbi:transmembrane protein -like [Brachionus plicatilis]|uniref:Transmembrane protein-like n=1 Tax=Brachionus plicatilis TaxID=10195 RepID=A0A3M7QHH4_BRAPC|nr:transmembrane protein -like [Brachionus plicatilis]